jgi:hypothetical protein
MSRVSPYGSIEKRTFESALIHLLETEYGLLGGRRTRSVQLLIDDVLALEKEFHPALEHTGSGSLVWTCTADEGKKAMPGKRTEEYKTVTVRLPFVVAEDVQDRTNQKTPRGQQHAMAQARDKRRLVRMVKAAAEQGGLLTLAELSVILNKSYPVVSQSVCPCVGTRDGRVVTAEGLPDGPGQPPDARDSIACNRARQAQEGNRAMVGKGLGTAGHCPRDRAQLEKRRAVSERL